MAPASEPEVIAYRGRASAAGLVSFRVAVKESDLLIACDRDLHEEARVALLRCRSDLESYIEAHPMFLQSLAPVPILPGAPRIVQRMAKAAVQAGVGPMAAVAGAVADEVGTALSPLSQEVLVENGGDIFCRVRNSRVVALDAGNSPLSYKFGIKISRTREAIGICTSSGTRGGSLSFGRADSACIIGSSATLADAAATAVGNAVVDAADIEKGLNLAQSIPGVLGVAVVVGEKMGAWGQIEFVELQS
jgi:ApbE superfamily uncharacterized protein (UPF0280 family)